MAHKVRRGAERIGEEEVGGAGSEAAAAVGAHEATKAGREVASTGAEEAEPASWSATQLGAECPHHHR